MADSTDAADAAARDEELCALEAIFGESVNASREDSFVEVCIPHPQGGNQEVVLRVSLPSDYPSSSCPVAVLYGSHLSDDVLAWAVKQLEKLFTPGDVVLYIWVEWLREQEILWAVPSAPSQQWLNSRQQQQQLEEEGAEGEGATHGSSRRAATVKVGGLRARVTHNRLWTAGEEFSKLPAARGRCLGAEIKGRKEVRQGPQGDCRNFGNRLTPR
ncbi:hypothetical protein Vretifemale_1804 [Volvox reticuliferus]|uniref:RWD domain-containing protein n=1 Tax=Volvox reticuliferus TaxID=1737510 RepID=A0A8J4BXK5_9CHLO|nr:hypothetical protein Vretifemale_1804 [Volvox reticuliferus]